MSGWSVPPDRQCRAQVAGQLNRGVYWSPPHRCLDYAGPNGYCLFHQPAEDQASEEDDPRAMDESDRAEG
jgi:hypothetical protein